MRCYKYSMSIYKKNGKYYCRFQIDGERHHYLCNGATSEKEARKIEDGFRYKLQQQQNGVIAKNIKKIKLSKILDMYLDYSKLNKKSYNGDLSIVTVIKTYFKDIYANDLNLSKLESFKKYLLEERKVSKATVNRYRSAISKAYNLAIANKFLKENPINEFKKLKEKNFMIRFLTKEEEIKLYNNLPANLKPLVTTALQTGMRKNEIFKLKWSNINFALGFIELLETKSGKSRKIPISDKLRDVLTHNLQVNIGGEYVFLNPLTSKPYSNISKSFKKALKAANIENFRFHDLRHTVATRLVEKGIDLVVVKEILGHSKIDTTLRYAHAVPKRKLEAIEVLNSYN